MGKVSEQTPSQRRQTENKLAQESMFNIIYHWEMQIKTAMK